MQSSHQARGFTLVEVMISVAFALVLMLGVNAVFQASTDTIGVGNSFIKAGEDARTIEATLGNDMAAVDPVYSFATPIGDGPAFIIMSQHQYGFRDSTDFQRATDQTKPYSDSNLFSNTTLYPTSNQCPVPMVHFRSHRVDRLGFFQRGIFPRQTSSNDSSMISPSYASEAWTFYGHSLQPNNAAIAGSSTGNAWLTPGQASTSTIKNDNNFYSSDWLLARQVMLLIPTPNSAVDNSWFASSATALSPLSYSTTNFVFSGSFPSYTVDLARLDVAATSISSYYTILNNYINANAGSSWWLNLMNYRLQASSVLIADPTVALTATTPKITPYSMAKSSPALVRGCSHFIVEYSGNFYTKKVDGSVLDPTTPDPSGINDFYMDTTTTPPTRRTRWYGFPRAVNSINTNTGGAVTLTSNNGDVVPLGDVIGAGNATAERTTSLPAGTTALPTPGFSPMAGASYWNAMSPSVDFTAPYTYIAAWGPDTTQPFPKMIRFVVGIDDRDGHLKNSQLYEYVFDVLP